MRISRSSPSSRSNSAAVPPLAAISRTSTSEPGVPQSKATFASPSIIPGSADANSARVPPPSSAGSASADLSERRDTSRNLRVDVSATNTPALSPSFFENSGLALTNAMKRPLPETTGESESALPSVPSGFTLTRSITGSGSTTNTSRLPFVSSATRFVARLANTSSAPLRLSDGESAGRRLSPAAGEPPSPKLTSSTCEVCAARSDVRSTARATDGSDRERIGFSNE